MPVSKDLLDILRCPACVSGPNRDQDQGRPRPAGLRPREVAGLPRLRPQVPGARRHPGDVDRGRRQEPRPRPVGRSLGAPVTCPAIQPAAWRRLAVQARARSTGLTHQSQGRQINDRSELRTPLITELPGPSRGRPLRATPRCSRPPTPATRRRRWWRIMPEGVWVWDAGRQLLSGFCRRHRRVRHRPLPSAGGARHPGPGRPGSFTCPAPTSTIAADRPGRARGRPDARRGPQARLLRQFRAPRRWSAR